ncbi:MAG: ribonuclease HI family protein [Terriglobales bacterium]
MPRRKLSNTPGLFPTETLFPTGTSRADQKALIAHIDGGARGNPGPAGHGVLLEDERGQEVARLSKYLGRQTNNYAEYSGLLAALEYALQHGYRNVQVLSDSELLVRQMKGIYKVKNEGLRPLYERSRQMIRQLDCFTIEHVRREQNRDADHLANLAMNQGTRK